MYTNKEIKTWTDGYGKEHVVEGQRKNGYECFSDKDLKGYGVNNHSIPVTYDGYGKIHYGYMDGYGKTHANSDLTDDERDNWL